VIRLVNQKLKRHLEALSHLSWIGLVFERRIDPSHNRRNDIAGSGGVVRNRAEHLHAVRGYARLFFRFAQGRVGGVAIMLFHAPARKADLPGVIGEVRGALREQHTRPGCIAAIHQQNQYCRRLQRLAGQWRAWQFTIVRKTGVATRGHVSFKRKPRGNVFCRHCVMRARGYRRNGLDRTDSTDRLDGRRRRARLTIIVHLGIIGWAFRMILYGYFRSSAAYRVRIAMNLKGLSPEHRSIHLLKRENRTDAYRAINPQGFVPYLVEEDAQAPFDAPFALAQSLAIIEYLEETHPQPPLLPRDARERAFARAIANVIACDIHPLNNPRVLDKLTDEFSMTDAQKTQWYCGWIAEGFRAIETMLAQRKTQSAFCVGDTPTIADICLIPQITNANRFKCALDGFPLINGIYARAMQLAAFDLAQPSKQPDANA
jgi:maleylacetoacetate isomerase